MYSDNPRYYQPPPPQPRYNSSTEQNWQPHQNQQYAQGNQGGGGGRYGQVGIGHRQPYSPTPHRAISSGRMRAWDDEVLSGNTAQTGFQPSGPPHMGHQQQQYPQAQQEQQWGHMPRHSLAGALSPGPPPFAGTTRSDLPHKHTSYHPRAYNPAYGPPAGIPPSVPSAMTSSQPHHSSPSQISTPDSSVQTLAPLNPLGTSDNSRRSSLARSAGEVANGGDRRASGAGGKGKNKRKNKRRQDDEREGEHDQKHLQAQGQAVERGAKKKVQGPPPKAKLGGPGGGTYGERRKQAANVEPAADLEGDALAVDGSASAEAASNAVGTSTKQTTQVQAQATTDQSSEDEPVQDATPMYKDKPIEVRLPHDVSRSDTAIAAAGGDLDPTLEDREEARGQEEHQLAVDNFTGPQEAAKVPLPETPDEEKATDAEAGVMWKGEEVIVALPSVPPPPQAVMSDASAWQPGPISQSQAVAQASTDGINESSKLDAPIALRVQAGDAHQQDILSPGFASPGGNDDFGASPSTIGRTRENSTSDYQATISRAAYLRPSAPAFLPAARVFQQSVTTPSVRNGIDEFPSVSMQNRVVSDTTGEGPRKKLRPSAPSFTPSHSSGPSRTSMSSAASHSRLNVAAQTFSPKKATKALADDLLALPDFSSTPGPSSRPSMTKVATSPASAARGTLRAGAPSFMPSGQGTFTFKPPVTAKGRPSLISAFERPGPDEMRDRSTEDRSPEKVMKSGYLGGLGSGMSLPLKGATILKTSPTEPDLTVDHTTEDATGEGIGENKEPKPEVSPAAPSEGDKFGSMSASELFFRPPIPTPGVEKDDIFSALGITPLKSKATSGNVSRSSLSGVEEIRHKPEASYDSEAGMRSGYVEDLGDYEGEDYGDEMGHAASSDIEPDLEEGNDRDKVEHETARAHLPTESFGLPSPRDTEEVATLGSAMLPSLQRVPRYIPQDQPSSPTTPVISESPMHHPPTGARYYTAPETPHKTLQGEQDVQISASPTPARRPSNVRLKSPTDQQIDSMQDRTFGDSTQYRPSPIQQQALNGDHAADDARFRNWIFPTPDKYERPGINRRYTMPLRDIATAPAYPAEEMPGPAGVASTTLAERVNVLRDVLGRAEGSYEPAARAEDVFGSGRSKAKGEHAEAPHRKLSVEFPIRQKTLKVVNATPKRQSLVDVEEIADTGGTGMAGTQMAIIDMLNEVKEALAGLALAANEPAKGESGLELRQILATVEGMRGDVLEVSGRRGRDHYEERQRDNELANLREQLMEQNERFDRLAEQLQAQESKEDTSRSDEMFTALLSGQHAMLDKFTAFSEDREVEGEQLVAAADALRIAREAAEKDRDLVKQKDDMIHALRQQLAEVKVSARTAAAERDELRTATAARASSEEGLRKELLDVKREVGEKKRAHEGMEEELTRARAGRQAAEAERDAIAGALGEAHGWREDTEAELTELRHQLELERSKPASTPVVTQIDMSSQVAELFSANKLFQDDLFAQIAFLQKDIVESREAQGEAVEEMKKEKGKLQSSIDRLESELDEAKTRATRSEIQSITEAEHNLATQTVLDSKLSSAIAARDTAQLKLAEVEKDVAKLREEKESLQVIATERSAATRQYEARLQALAQENVYWRQFALSYDRREYRKFLGSKPFRDADGNPVDSTLTGRIDHDAVTVIRETTEGSGQPANPSPVLQTPFAPAGDRAFLTPTATPLNKGKGKAPPSTGGSSLQDTPDLSSSTSTVLSTRAPSKQ